MEEHVWIFPLKKLDEQLGWLVDCVGDENEESHENEKAEKDHFEQTDERSSRC